MSSALDQILLIPGIGRRGEPSPLSLFKNGEQGWWYDPSDLSTLFQDSAGTMPVTADNQPVRLMLDKSGNNNHMLSTTDAKRPVYKTDGTFHWLQPNGSSHSMSTESINMSAFDGLVCGLSISRPVGNTGNMIPIEFSTNSGSGTGRFGWFVQAVSGTSGTLSFRLEGSIATTTALIRAIQDDKNIVVIGRGDIADDILQSYISGQLDSNITVDKGTGNLDNQILYLFARNNASSFFSGRFYGSIGTTNNTLESVAICNNWLSDKNGTRIEKTPPENSRFLSGGFLGYDAAVQVEATVIPEVPATGEAEIREIGNVIYEPHDVGKEYKHWYTGKDGAEVKIYYAYSSDGRTWTKHPDNPVVTSRDQEDPYVVKSGSTYYMYCEEYPQPPFRIRRWSSTDGVNWTDLGLINTLNGQSPTVWIEGTTWYMLYEEMASPETMHLATSSDGETWVESEFNPVLTSATTSWNSGAIVPDDIVKRGSTYFLFMHSANDALFARSGVLTSQDLITWADQDLNPLHPVDYQGGLTSNQKRAIHIQPFRIGNEWHALYWGARTDGVALGYLAVLKA